MKRLWIIILVPAAVLSLSSCDSGQAPPASIQPGWTDLGAPIGDVCKCVDKENGVTVYIFKTGYAGGIAVVPKEKP